MTATTPLSVLTTFHFEENISSSVMNISSRDMNISSTLIDISYSITNISSTNSSFLESEICGAEPNWEVVNIFYFWISVILSSITAVLGILGNILSLVVLCKKSTPSVFNNLLASLCVADLIFLLSNLLNILLNLMDMPLDHAMQVVSETCVQVSTVVSVFLILSITIERHQVVCSPHAYQALMIARGPTRLLLIYLVPVLLSSLILTVPIFIQKTPLGLHLQRNYSAYVIFLLCFRSFHPLATTGLLPLILLTTLNYRIYGRIRDTRTLRLVRKRAKDFMMARIIMMLVVVFLILNMPRLILGLREVTQIFTILHCYENNFEFKISETFYLADFIARYCMVVNSSINFVIYCMIGSEFRCHLWTMLGLKRQSDVIVQIEGIPLADIPNQPTTNNSGNCTRTTSCTRVSDVSLNRQSISPTDVNENINSVAIISNSKQELLTTDL